MKTRALTREEREYIEPTVNDQNAAKTAHIEASRWLREVQERMSKKMKEIDPNAVMIDHPHDDQWVVHIRESDEIE